MTGWTGARSRRCSTPTPTAVESATRSSPGTPAPRIGGGVVAVARWSEPHVVLSADGVAIVTWLRDGHLCMVSGRGVSRATLLKLASWSDRDASAS